MTVIYDVETSGIPDWKKPSNDPSQPHIIQVAALHVDDDFKVISLLNHYIKPDGWMLSKEITELTGITQERLQDEGIPIAEATTNFIEMWRKSKLTVAHNDSFDRRCFRIEMARLYGKVALLDAWKNSPSFCTMNESKNLVKLPPTAKMLACGFDSFKPPKLEEAYEFFYNKKPEKAHDAMADVETTLAVYQKILESRKVAV